MSNLDVDVQTVCAMVRARMVPQGRTIIAIAGPPASGKSTLAEAVVRELVSNVEQAEPSDVPLAVLLPMDGYHLDNRLLESKANNMKKDISIIPGFAKGAFEELISGDSEKHDRIIIETAIKIANQCDIIVLAQGFPIFCIQSIALWGLLNILIHAGNTQNRDPNGQ